MAQRKRKSNPELDARRAEIRRLHHNATRKISRLKQQGVHIAAHGMDPRVDLRKIHTYNSRQLESHAQRLADFNSRRTAFVPGSEGKPLPKQKFNYLLKLAQGHNVISNERRAGRDDITLPGQKLTIGQRHADVISKVRARGDVYNYPYEQVNFKSTDIVNIDKLIKDMEKKNNRSFIKKVVKDQRKQLKQMMSYVGDQHLFKDIDALTDNQFDILFNDGKFGDYYSRKYWKEKETNSGKAKRSDADMGTQTDKDITGALEWAKTLPKTAPGSEAPAD